MHTTGITPLTSCPAMQTTSKSSRSLSNTRIFEIDGPHVVHPLYAWQPDVKCILKRLPPCPDTSLHDPRPSPSPQIMSSSAPTCTFRSHTVISTPLTRTSVRNSILADPLDIGSEVRRFHAFSNTTFGRPETSQF